MKIEKKTKNHHKQMCFYNERMKLFIVICACFLNCAAFASPPTNFFVFGKDVPLDIQYNNPNKNYNTPEGMINKI